MKSIPSILAILFIVLFHSAHGHAHEVINDNSVYCQNAKTTADLVACTKTRLNEENKYLQDLFNATQAVYESEPKMQTQIKENQQKWLSYRDSVCAVEASLYDGGSLAVVQETSCLARVTANRSNHYLAMLRARDDTAVPVFSNPPRWVNVLGEEYSDVFWAIPSKLSVDVDCDGTDEVILSGIRQNMTREYQNIVAIADSKKTGRPQISILNFDDTKDCNIILGMMVEDQAGACDKKVLLQTENCGEFAIDYNTETAEYQLLPNQTDKIESNDE